MKGHSRRRTPYLYATSRVEPVGARALRTTSRTHGTQPEPHLGGQQHSGEYQDRELNRLAETGRKTKHNTRFCFEQLHLRWRKGPRRRTSITSPHTTMSRVKSPRRQSDNEPTQPQLWNFYGARGDHTPLFSYLNKQQGHAEAQVT